MIKTLCEIGNSLGVVIDKAILDAAEIDRATLLRLRVFGRRLIIEPAPVQNRVDGPTQQPNSDPDLRKPRATVPILDELVAREMDDDRFRRLHHAKRYLNTIKRHRDYCLRPEGGDFTAGGTNERTARRLLACLEALRAGKSWEEAIAEALERFPKP